MMWGKAPGLPKGRNSLTGRPGVREPRPVARHEDGGKIWTADQGPLSPSPSRGVVKRKGRLALQQLLDDTNLLPIDDPGGDGENPGGRHWRRLGGESVGNRRGI